VEADRTLGSRNGAVADRFTLMAMVVDLTPAADRPYVGSSTDNSEMELIFDHNGVQRLSNQASINSGTLVGFDIPTTSARLAPRDDNRLSSPDYPHGQSPSLSSGDIDRAGNATRGPVGLSNGPGGAFDVGQPGWLRLFTQPLADQTGWLLPLALFAIPLILAVLGWKWSLTEQQASVVLWVGWLLPQMAYFSFTSGLWHVYYLIMLGSGHCRADCGRRLGAVEAPPTASLDRMGIDRIDNRHHPGLPAIHIEGFPTIFPLAHSTDRRSLVMGNRIAGMAFSKVGKHGRDSP